MTSRPLVVAMVAMGLLVVSVGFEVIVRREYAVDVRVDDAWRTIAESATGNEPYRTRPLAAVDPIVANASDTLTFRLRVDNGYPWSFRENYFVTTWEGITVADGEINAPGRGFGEATFTVALARILEARSLAPEGKTSEYQTASFNVQVDDVFLSASFDVREAN